MVCTCTCSIIIYTILCIEVDLSSTFRSQNYMQTCYRLYFQKSMITLQTSSNFLPCMGSLRVEKVKYAKLKTFSHNCIRYHE